MSLDTLFEQILVTEQQLTEQTQRIKEGMFVFLLEFRTEKYAKANIWGLHCYLAMLAK